ncbi:MAG: carboxypeptidase-like regulatory domain-containing protein [Bacteroidota bacterium]
MGTRIITLFTGLLSLAIFAQEQRTVSGKISDGNNRPVENVNISVVGRATTTVSDADGKYQITVATGEMLQYSYVGMKTIQIQVEDVTRILNPVMVPDINELKGVVLKGNTRRSQKDLERDYWKDEKIIKTFFGYVDADTSPGRVRLLGKNQINPAAICILDLLRNRFAGILVVGDCQIGGNVYMRRTIFSSVNNRLPMIFDIDGQIFSNGSAISRPSPINRFQSATLGGRLAASSAPVWIDVNNIKRIAILDGLANTVKYGSFGNGGVVVINTFSGNYNAEKFVDRARLRNNYVDEKEVVTKAQMANNVPTYLKALRAAGSLEAAKAIYTTYKMRYASSPYFALDTYNYFYDQWSASAYADAIIDDNYDLFMDNAVLLKALAYCYESQGRYEKANTVFKDVFILRPNYAQSYMDMANSFRSTGNVRQAASLYARYNYLLQEGFMRPDTIGFSPIINREYNNLLMLNKEAVVSAKRVKKLYVAEEDFKGTRLVFEWNDSEAEFDLQFVTPGNQYYKWKHSLAENEETILREKQKGYACTEYLIDDSLPGTWKVNMKYLGNKSLTPTYMKATIYHNFGTRAQRKEVKVFKLTVKNVNHELFAVEKNTAVVSR